MQGILANFDIQREFSAPPGYNILVIPMTHLFVMMVLRFQLIFVQILKDQYMVMLNMQVYMYQFLKDG